MASKVYWTGTTRSGCAGQFTNCFEETSEDDFEEKIVASGKGGACVAVTTQSESLLAHSLGCDSLVLYACQSTKNTPSLILDNVVVIIFLNKNLCSFSSVEFNAQFVVE